jgi:hypothetical protein
MSGLQRAQRRIAPRTVSEAMLSKASARRRPAVRSRIPRAEGVTLPALWRLLAIAACAVILGGGGLLAFQFVEATAPAPAPEDHRRLAIKAASILGSPAAPERPKAEAAPTAEDFARPAFLEPLPAAGDQPGPATAPAREAGAVPDTVASAAPGPQVAALETAMPAAAPLPPERPQVAAERTARIVFDVTMRSGPRRGASAIGQLDRNARVTLIGCKSWCEVVADGKRGFVYSRAVDRKS